MVQKSFTYTLDTFTTIVVYLYQSLEKGQILTWKETLMHIYRLAIIGVIAFDRRGVPF